MKLLLTMVGALIATALPLIAKADGHADHAVVGKWDSAEVGDPPSYLIVNIGHCADDESKFCGEIIDAPGSTTPDYVMNKFILVDLIDQGDGKFGKGQIWNPLDGNMYAGKMELLEADTLKVSGCVFTICQSQIWTRTPM